MQDKKISIVNKALAIVAGATLFGAIAPVRGDITKSFIDQKDEMILGNSAGMANGNSSGIGPGMFAGADSGGGRKRALMQFDIAGNIPAGATITDVKLTLVLGQIAGTGSGTTGGSAIPTRTLNLFAVQQPWVEGLSGGIPGSNPPKTSPTIGGTGQGSATASPDSSWDYADFNSADPTSGKWNNGTTDLHGGNVAATASGTETFHGDPANSNNFTSLVDGTQAPTAASIFTWDSADAGSSGMLADVQNWLDNPTTNDGWLLRAMSGIESNGTVIPDLEAPAVPPGQSFLGFWTRDGAMANNNLAIAPTLTVTYTPEPAIGTLSLLAAPFVLPRRRSVPRRRSISS